MGVNLKRLISSCWLRRGHEIYPSPLQHCNGREISRVCGQQERKFHLAAGFAGHRGRDSWTKLPGFTRFGWCGIVTRSSSYSQVRGQCTKLVTQEQRAYWRSHGALLAHYAPFSTKFGVMGSALVFTCARHHLTLPILVLTLGKAWINGSMAEAEYLGSRISMQKSLQPSFASLFSFFLSALESLFLCLRALQLFLLFTPAIVTAPFANAFGGRCRDAWFRLMRRSFELAGAAFIKWGQWAATRPDLFPRDLCREFSILHTQAPSHDFSYTKCSVEGAFGRKLDEIFEDFEEEPLASGSIAQVHRATLRYPYPGQASKPMLVAVKVRHPGVSDVIKRDFSIIHWIARFSNLVPSLRWLRLEESVQQFAVFMLTQVDLSREAAQLNRFIYNFRRWKDVSFPKPLYPLVHPAVLVETFEQGESVSQYLEHSVESCLNSTLASIGTHTLLKMLLVDNFIHADMHPGNILVRVNKKGPSGKRLSKSRPHVILLDVGMTAELSRKDRNNLLDFFKAVAVRDGRTAAQCCLKFSQVQSCPDPDDFIKEVEASFTFWGTEKGDDIHPAECMQQLLEQVRCHKVNIDGNVCTVMVTMLVLEGWQRKLDPHYNVMKTLQSLLFKADWAKSLSYTIERIMAP